MRVLGKGRHETRAMSAGGDIEVDEEMAKEVSQYGGGQDNDPLQPPHSAADTAAGALIPSFVHAHTCFCDEVPWTWMLGSSQHESERLILSGRPGGGCSQWPQRARAGEGAGRGER
jgi:hypothetical protein